MQTAVEIEASIQAKADEDPGFRSQLVKDPKSAIRELTGVDIPEQFSIHVHEESATDFHLVLPPVNGRMSDEELGIASGGFAPSAGNNNSY